VLTLVFVFITILYVVVMAFYCASQKDNRVGAGVVFIVSLLCVIVQLLYITGVLLE